MILLLLAWVGFFGEVRGRCDTLPNNPSHGTIIWNDKTAAIKDRIGHVECNPGYQLPAIAPLVTCKDDDWIVTKCSLSSDNSEIVEFAGLVYNYTEVKISAGSRTYPLRSDLAYVFIAKYTASKATPTVRVHVGLKGKADKPVLINIQQSSESIGFELPYKVVSSDNRHPQTPYTAWVQELCPGISKVEEDHDDTRAETVEVHVRTTATYDPSHALELQLQVTYVSHLEITDIPSIIKINPADQAIYRYTWPDGVKEVEINFGHVIGEGEDVCATASIRTAQCPIEEMGGSSLTFTRKGSFILNKENVDQPKLKNGFIIVLTVLSDDWRCRSSDREKSLTSRKKTVTLTVTPQTPHIMYSYLVMPVLTSVAMLFGAWVFITQVIDRLAANVDQVSRPLPAYTNLAIHCDDTVPIISEVSDDDDGDTNIEVPDLPIHKAKAILPPFDRHEYSQTKQVDIDEDEDNFLDMDNTEESTLPERSCLPDPHGIYTREEEVEEKGERRSMARDIFNTVVDKVPQKYRDTIVNMTQNIGHYGLPIVLFLTNFDNVFDDIRANLVAFSVKGDQDSCYYNAKCAFPTVIQGYRIPDISRVTSNIPYICSGLTFFWIVSQKHKATLPFDKKERGIRHDFSLFSVLSLITCMVGLASAVYHTCPNESTSRIDMFFIEMYLAYVSLKIYQSRSNDIRRLFYVPGMAVTVLGFSQRLLGVTPLSWFIVGAVHIAFTLTICLQLFFLGNLTFNPITIITRRHELMTRIKNRSSDPSFNSRAAFFTVAAVANTAIALTGMFGLWKSYAMYNVIAIAADIVVYIAYYMMMKYIVHKEKKTYHVVMLGVGSIMFWTFSVLAFLSYKSTNTALSPAESRCYNKDCIVGPIEGHDLWHCLSAVAILLTNMLVISLDDDLINKPTDKIPIF